MPIQVDREQQRDYVTQVAAEVIANEGVEALTFRRIAAEAGTSTAIVSRYFDDKQDLLLATFTYSARRSSARFEGAVAAGGGLQACLQAWLPLDEERLVHWKVVFAFIGVAVSNPELARIQEGHLSRARVRIESFLMQGKSSRVVPAQVHRDAETILALTLGIAMQAVFDSARSRRVPQKSLLASGLRELGAIR